MSNLQARNSVFYIYNSFKYYLFYAMKERDLEKCSYIYHNEMNKNNILHFRAASNNGDRRYNITITLETGVCEYDHIDRLIDVFERHRYCDFEIDEYDCCMDEFYIIFKRTFHNSNTVRVYTYSVCDYGVALKDIKEYYHDTPLYERIYNEYIYGMMTMPDIEYTKTDSKSLYDIYKDNIKAELNAVFGSTFSDLTANDIRRQLQLPICKELPTFKFDSLSGFIRVPTLSKPPIFNDPATICYWTDGTKTVVKCQEGDTYSPEAGLALCYMKKILGNTSKDLNKELHKYIPEEIIEKRESKTGKKVKKEKTKKSKSKEE